MRAPDLERSKVSAQRVPVWKRAMDVSIAATVLTVGAPVLALVAAGSRVFLGPGVLYRQERGGHGGTSFELLKFRSMLDLRDENGNDRSLEERSHPWGEFLRVSSLDEVPGLVNVLRGEMCLVGPRPFLASYLDRYDQDQAQRHRLPPGLTGLAQTSGRNLLEWEEKFELDNRYVDELSLREDVRILLRTAGQVLTPWKQRNTGHAPEFFGTASTATSTAIANGN